tara:strand:- start:470 stop:1519 length:1050 start_codon:yes stop_codon:yes gene_type:complete
MKIVIRVDANPDLGYGHISRCINLAKEFKNKFNCQIYFLMASCNKFYTNKIKNHNFKINLINSSKFVDQKNDSLKSNKFLKELKPDLLILDHYKLGIYWENSVKKNVKKLLVIDDLKRKHNCNFFIDQNFSSLFKKKIFNKILNRNAKILIGPKYSLIDKKYSILKNKKKKLKKTKNILINFGSYDINNLTCKVLKYILTIKYFDYKIKIIVEKNFKFLQMLQNLSKNNKSIKIYSNLNSLDQITFQSDICFGAGGINNIERICLEKINYVVSTSANQIENCRTLNKKQYIFYIGHFSKINNKTLKKKISKIIFQNNKIKLIKRKISKLVDGKGSLRVVDFIAKEFKNE